MSRITRIAEVGHRIKYWGIEVAYEILIFSN